jgi:hypothetical protein
MKYIRPILRSKLFRIFFIIYLAFFVFDKAFSIDLITNDETIVELTVGQLQTFDIDTIQHIRFYPDEFSSFSVANSSTNFIWYGQPGSEHLNGTELTGDLSPYTMLVSTQINFGFYSKQAFTNWFNNFPYEVYPAEEEPDDSGGGGSDFDINDLDYDLAATFFAGGFAIFLLPWINAYGFSALLGFIKKG